MDFGLKFKTALFGFSKKDVVRCIQELNEDHSEELEELRAEISEIQKKYESLQKVIEEKEQLISTYVQQRDEQQKKNQALESVVKRLIDERKDAEAEITRLRQASLSNSSRISELQFSNHDLQKKLDEAEDKLDKYNELCENISDVMLDAQRASAQLQQNAEHEAKQIVDEAHRSVEQIGDDARKYHHELDTISQSLNNAILQLQTQLENMENRFSASDEKEQEMKASEERLATANEKKAKSFSTARYTSHRPTTANDFLGKVKEWLK
jgi:chromosome segregation ATPase